MQTICFFLNTLSRHHFLLTKFKCPYFIYQEKTVWGLIFFGRWGEGKAENGILYGFFGEVFVSLHAAALLNN